MGFFLILPVGVLQPLGLLPDWYFPCCVGASGLSNSLALLACRRAGVSQEAEQHTLIERDPRAALTPFLGKAPVFSTRAISKPHVVVDREGIEAKQVHGQRRRVAWSDIETCTCDLTRDAVGSITSAEFTLQGTHEMPLLRFEMNRQSEQVLAAIRFYLRGEEASDWPRAAL